MGAGVGFGGSAGLVAAGGETAATCAPGLAAAAPPLRSSSRCISRICFSRSATRDCDSCSALFFAVSSSCSALRRSCEALPAAALPLAESDLEMRSVSLGAADGAGGGVTAAEVTRPLAALEPVAASPPPRDGAAAEAPASWSR